MQYLLNLNGHFYFQRRVPIELKDYDSRRKVRFSLKTDSRKEAIRLATLHNSHLESYWRELIATGNKHSQSRYESVVQRARLFGFRYEPIAALASGSLKEIVSRLQHVQSEKFNATHVEAALGGVDMPEIRLDELFPRYCEYVQETILSKSNNQLRKWKRPRERAVVNFIIVVGNKIISEVTREDILKFKNWWLARIKSEQLTPNSANKNFIQLRVMIDTINENLDLKLNIETLFKKILLKEEDENTREPFTTEYLRNVLLNPASLVGLEEEAKAILFAFAETGAGLSELVGLLPEDIKLADPIPHIIIQPRDKKKLKTRYRKRTIPLVGFALDAFIKFPHGFEKYEDRADALSAIIGAFLREKNLFPTAKHTVYSLRHSFQDRLLASEAPDRVQADLMGHKFSRQAYGKGATLEQKQKWLEKIRLKP